MAWLRVLVCLVISSTAFAAPRKGVNAVLGDDSWIARFGVVPDENVDEDLRLRVHLEHVEELLRANTPSGLSDEQRAERARNLDRLSAYIARGEFPRNRSVQGRRPHFIDEDGRICAVGFLVEQSAGRAVAEAINARHEWDYIEDIRGIDAWVEQSGLTLVELAMIQPGYGHMRPRPPPPPPDETMRQRQLVANAFANARAGVQACAQRFRPLMGSVSASVTVFRFGATVNVDMRRLNGRSFLRCVQRSVERSVANAGIGFRWRAQAMTIHHTFAIEQEWEDEYGEYGWSQPPPR